MILLVKPFPMDEFLKLVRLIQDEDPGAWNAFGKAIEGMGPLHAASFTLCLHEALNDESEEQAQWLRLKLKGAISLEVAEEG